MLRRGYNFVDGSDGLGRLDAGLFFLAYQRDPRAAFIPVQDRLARHDALNEYIEHVGSAVLPARPVCLPANIGAGPVRPRTGRRGDDAQSRLEESNIRQTWRTEDVQNCE
jgi:deferrochelatase/peroxidase EfeB